MKKAIVEGVTHGRDRSVVSITFDGRSTCHAICIPYRFVGGAFIPCDFLTVRNLLDNAKEVYVKWSNTFRAYLVLL